MQLTTNRKLGAASGELEEISSFWKCELAHCLKQILHTLAIHVEAMVSLDRVHESCEIVSEG